VRHSLTVYWGTFKNNQKSHEIVINVKATGNITCPVALLREYFSLTEHFPKSGPLFYEDGLNEPISIPSSRVSTKSMATWLQEMHSKAGFGSVKLASIRPTAASNAAASGASVDAIKAYGRWNSDVYLRYIRSVAAETDMASDIGL
jgi:hypothetical protein